jgi:hypothetical protein
MSCVFYIGLGDEFDVNKVQPFDSTERRSRPDTAHPPKGIRVKPLFVFRPEPLGAVVFRSSSATISVAFYAALLEHP